MTSHLPTRSWIILLCLLLVGLLLTIGVTLDVVTINVRRAVTWGEILLWSFARWYVWIALFPLILWLGRRFPFDAQHWRTSVIVHLGASLLVSASVIALQAELRVQAGFTPAADTFLQSFRWLLPRRLPLYLLAFGLLVGIGQALLYHWRWRERELRAVQLESQLVKAQWQTLKMQLHPHFLFNTLSHIVELIHTQPKIAERMLIRLSELLRLTLDARAADEVPLRQELAFLQKYLDLEQLRFEERLQVKLAIAPPTLDHPVPNLLLQPLVENAIQHGLAARPGIGLIEIEAKLAADELQLQIRDNGSGIAENGQIHDGIGLHSTRERLTQMYGRQARLTLRNRASGGLEVVIAIPRKL
jgi:hypothetical protein